MRVKEPTADRFWRQVDKTDGECWRWRGAISTRGYGIFRVARQNVYAHRWAYEQLNGPIPEGQVLDHLCTTPSCVHPYHLEAVSNRENILRGYREHLTHCKRGHEFTPENTKVMGSGRRTCRECANARYREMMQRRYHGDPDFRARRLAQGRASYHRNKGD